MCGIYMIRCKAVGKYYIGGTTLSFQKRFTEHRTALAGGYAPRMLQACHDLFGLESLEFLPLRTLNPDEVAAREREAIAELQPELNIYGVRARSGGSGGSIEINGRRMTLAQASKMSGVDARTISYRKLRGLTDEALIAPPHKAPRKPYVRHK